MTPQCWHPQPHPPTGTGASSLKIEQMRFYVYLYRDPNGAPIYIGKGTRKRAWAHVNRFGSQPEIVFRTDDEREALAHESILIARYKRRMDGGSLVNRNEGGNGRGTGSQNIRTRILKAACLRVLGELTGGSSFDDYVGITMSGHRPLVAVINRTTGQTFAPIHLK